MKKQIRRSCFETNSSSTHAICITKRKIDKDNLPSEVEFKHDEFGWEFRVHEDILTKASDLYTYENDKRKNNYINWIYEVLGKYGIECNFDTKDKDEDGFSVGYIDHVFETRDFVNAVMNNENRLLRYLFGESKIITGNDNSETFDEYMESHDFSDYDVYYKGN